MASHFHILKKKKNLELILILILNYFLPVLVKVLGVISCLVICLSGMVVQGAVHRGGCGICLLIGSILGTLEAQLSSLRSWGKNEHDGGLKLVATDGIISGYLHTDPLHSVEGQGHRQQQQLSVMVEVLLRVVCKLVFQGVSCVVFSSKGFVLPLRLVACFKRLVQSSW